MLAPPDTRTRRGAGRRQLPRAAARRQLQQHVPPQVTADGQTYERIAIENWLARQQAQQRPCTSPLTGEPLVHTHLVPNIVLRGMIREFLERHPELALTLGTGAAFANV